MNDPVSPDELRQGVRLFIEQAYDGEPPPRVLRYLPPAGSFDPERFLMSDLVERSPDVESFDEVRSFALRIGCSHYRHLKLRLARPGNRSTLVFMVDAHDTFLQAPPGSPDEAGLEHLKRANADTMARILKAWDEAGLRTEKRFLRDSIRRARDDSAATA